MAGGPWTGDSDVKIEVCRPTGTPVLVWRLGPGWRMLSSSVLGGGLGPREWVLNARVPSSYARLDPDVHAGELASACGLSGPGVGMLTAAAVDHYSQGTDDGVSVTATVGLSVPTWAAAPRTDGGGHLGAPPPGTINLIAALPVPLGDAALVDAVVTATEAKAQALFEAGVPGTGTASDAICVAVPEAGHHVSFCGPRSEWGARLARAVHTAVLRGTKGWRSRHPNGTPIGSALASP